jgi:hypothetical protein
VQTPGLERRFDRLERRMSGLTWAMVLVALCLSGTQLLLGGREAAGWALLGLAGLLFIGLLLVG